MLFHHVIETFLGDPANIRVYRILLSRRGGTTGRGLGSLANISSFKISKILENLVLQGIVDYHVVGRSHLYRLNEKHIFFPWIEKLMNFETELLPMLGNTVMKKLHPKPLSIILYGSVARGDQRPNSDLDLLFVYADKNKAEPFSDTMGEIIEYIVTNYRNMASIIPISVSEFQHPPDHKRPLIRNIIKDGITLAGLSIVEVINYAQKTERDNRIAL